ncbi:MAG: hypothetical protein Kow0068_18520 [Marinilabiliales bacterium]
MKIRGFFKLPKNKQFSYTPRYYDPEKEKREARNNEIKREMGIVEKKEYKPDLKGKLVESYSPLHRKSQKTPFLKLIIGIVSILLILTILYMVFYLSSVLLKNA